MYHCGTAPVLAHIANGMYGAIIVDPKAGLPKVDHSYVLVSGEWYLAAKAGNAPYTLDFAKARQKRPDFVTWNGYAAQYKDIRSRPRPGRPCASTSWMPARASTPTSTSSAPSCERVYLDGTTTDVLHNVQTQLVPAGGGMVFDVTFHQKGIYPFVSHSFASVDMGEVGLVNVGNVAGTMSH